MHEKTIEHCPKCSKQLVGAIEVNSAVIGGISMIVMEETPDRNWILCDFCNQTICKNCCVMPDSGYCDKCFCLLKIVPNLP
jgi:hypothetical protein